MSSNDGTSTQPAGQGDTVVEAIGITKSFDDVVALELQRECRVVEHVTLDDRRLLVSLVDLRRIPDDERDAVTAVDRLAHDALADHSSTADDGDPATSCRHPPEPI
mgnify:CR=1 FL=1